MGALARSTVKIASVVFIVVLVVSMFTSIVYADNSGKDNCKAVLERCIERLEDSIERINDIASSRGITLPGDISGNLTLAKQLLQDARGELNADNCDQARIYIRQAMESLRIAAAYICKAVKQEIRETLSERAARGLEVAIEMHRKFLDRLNNTVEYLKGKGIEVPDDVKTHIDNAYGILDEAEASLREGRINETARLLGESKREIAGLIGELHRVIRGEVEEGRIAKEVWKHLKRMEDVARGAEERVRDVAKRGRKAALEMVDGMIEKLENIKHDLENLGGYFRGKGNVKAVGSINAAIQKVKERIDQLHELRKNISK